MVDGLFRYKVVIHTPLFVMLLHIFTLFFSENLIVEISSKYLAVYAFIFISKILIIFKSYYMINKYILIKSRAKTNYILYVLVTIIFLSALCSIIQSRVAKVIQNPLSNN